MSDIIYIYIYIYVDINGVGARERVDKLGGGEWVCGHGCVHVLGVNGYGGKSSGTVRVEW